MTNRPQVRLRRVYDKPTGEDGTRVLVDRVWPRGLSKDKARIDQWYKQVARPPSCANGTPTTRAVRGVHPPVRAELKDPERAEALTRLRG
jgi:Protein of unknown function, DUF488